MKTIRHVIFYFVIACSFVCQIAVADDPFSEAKEVIKRDLKDPDSANFRELKEVTNSKGARSVVGEVNARNSYGGYTGFQLFVVTEGRAWFMKNGDPLSMKAYKLSGAAGPKEELLVRLEDEADFSANVTWTLMTNVIIDGQTKDSAVDTAIQAAKANAEANGVTIPEQQLALIKAQYSLALDQTLSNPAQVEQIKTNTAYMRETFVSSLKMNLQQTFKSQLGLQAADEGKLAAITAGKGKIGVVFQNRIVTQIAPQSPAESSGLRAGDVMLSADGMALTGDTAHDVMLITGPPGSKLTLEIMRGAEKLTLNIVRGAAQ